MKQTKVIKRYANRKLYDTERSCYVTLDEISQMIKEGEEVRVVDNKSKDDLTAVTLAQIIVEEEKKVAKMPLKLLRSIIQSGNEAIGDFVQKRVADPVTSLRDDVTGRVESLFKRDKHDDKVTEPKAAEHKQTDSKPPEPKPADLKVTEHKHDDVSDDVKRGVMQEFVASTSEAFETWQRRIDERVREAVLKMGGVKGSPDVEALRTRIEGLEAKIHELEAKKSRGG